jgi:hypothetical protein
MGSSLIRPTFSAHYIQVSMIGGSVYEVQLLYAIWQVRASLVERPGLPRLTGLRAPDRRKNLILIALASLPGE